MFAKLQPQFRFCLIDNTGGAFGESKNIGQTALFALSEGNVHTSCNYCMRIEIDNKNKIKKGILKRIKPEERGYRARTRPILSCIHRNLSQVHQPGNNIGHHQFDYDPLTINKLINKGTLNIKYLRMGIWMTNKMDHL